jgi:hypothetical protein
VQTDLAARVSSAAERLEMLNERFANLGGGTAPPATRR